MAEYIEREALRDALYDADAITMSGVKILNQFPVADVAHVRHGRWGRSGQLLECQCCGEVYSQLGGNAGKAWNFCPNCGADMRGSNDE